jgi:hypothetical protein
MPSLSDTHSGAPGSPSVAMEQDVPNPVTAIVAEAQPVEAEFRRVEEIAYGIATDESLHDLLAPNLARRTCSPFPYKPTNAHLWTAAHRRALSSEVHLRTQLAYANAENPGCQISLRQAAVLIRAAVGVVDNLIGETHALSDYTSSGPCVGTAEPVFQRSPPFCTEPATVLRLRGGAGSLALSSLQKYGSYSSEGGDSDSSAEVGRGVRMPVPSVDTQHISDDLCAARQVPLRVVPATVNSVVGDLLRKQLAKVVKPPVADLWSDSDPDTYLLAMDRFVDVSGAPGNDIHLLRVVWLT